MRVFYMCLLIVLVTSSGIPAMASGGIRTVALGDRALVSIPRIMALSESSNGCETRNFHGFLSPTINDLGNTAFFATFSHGDATIRRGVLKEIGKGSIQSVSEIGSPVPSAGPELEILNFDRLYTINQTDPPSFDNNGTTSFRVRLTGTGITSVNDGAILRERQGTGLQAIVREGEPAIGTALGFNYGRLGVPSLSSNGLTAFETRLTGPNEVTVGEAVVAESLNRIGLHIVAKTGDTAPIDDHLAKFSGFTSPTINSSGQIAFGAGITGSSAINSSNNVGLFGESNGGELRVIARRGDQVPGAFNGVDVRFHQFSPPVLNDASQTVFRADLQGTPNNEGIFREDPSTGLKNIALRGAPAPDMGSGVSFAEFRKIPPALNNNGQAAFSARLMGPGIDATNDGAIFAEDVTGTLRLIAQSGDLLDVSDDPSVPDTRTIRFLILKAGGINKIGQVAFLAAFTDGTGGIFVSDLVAIPEPTSLLLTLAGLLTVGCRNSLTHR